MMYEVLTGQSILLFQTLADAITCARFIKGVVRNPETHDIYADFYNERTIEKWQAEDWEREATYPQF